MTRVTCQIAGRELRLETGKLAKQANGAVLAQYGDTVVLAAVTMTPEPSLRGGFFPLTVDYRERTSAAGKFPGGFFKREGRPTEKEILTSRQIDRSIRPLFPEDLLNEVQIAVTVFAADEDNDPDVVSMIAVYAALAVSDVPFNAFLGAVRIGRLDGKLVQNPTYKELATSTLNIVVAGKSDGLVMVEGSAKEEVEATVVEALELAHHTCAEIAAKVRELGQAAAVAKQTVPPLASDPELQKQLEEKYLGALRAVLKIADKKPRERGLSDLYKQVQADLNPDADTVKADILNRTLHKLESDILRGNILQRSERIDGRGLNEIRPIACEVGLMPRVHGSALFTRGQTQAFVEVTLGTVSDQQQMDTLIGETFKKFMLHYTFPPFSTGEVKPMRGPGRREIGHGILAERALTAVLPNELDFPYTIRISSDILESNGSSSMASVCGGSLSLMDAGVPITKAVAGIAMGLITDGANYRILSDILGTEDHLGDMDFKVAGTADGITAVQMDIKVESLPRQILTEALEQARQGRLHILGKMNAILDRPRGDLSPFAPRIIIVFIHPDKIREVIGPGGKVIHKIIEETGVKIDIEDDGKVIIASADLEAGRRAKEIVEYLVAEAEVGKIYKGKVTRIANFGAFVEILPGKEGLVHISELEDHRVNQVEDVVHEGDEVMVRVIQIDNLGRIDLSRKDAMRELEGRPLEPREPREDRPHSDRGPGGGGGGRGGDRPRRPGGGGGGGGRR